MFEEENSKQFDLEERTFQFARRTRAFVKTLARTLGNLEDARQVIRSSGSVGANYIEANEALSKKDFVVRIKICRKEAKRVVIGCVCLKPSTSILPASANHSCRKRRN